MFARLPSNAPANAATIPGRSLPTTETANERTARHDIGGRLDRWRLLCTVLADIWPRTNSYSRGVRIGEVMTQPVVTAGAEEPLGEVGEYMRDRNVGSVVVCEAGRPVALITDRDVALAVAADGVGRDQPCGDYATRPLVTGDSGMEIEEAAALMVQHRIRRLPVTEEDELAGIVTLDDLAVRAGDLQLAQRMTAEVARAALPEFFFHQRGG